MIFLLDSNVISELWKPSPSPEVIQWISTAEWLVPVVVIAEIQEGAESAPSAARKEEINRRLDDFLWEAGSLIVEWDVETARAWARLQHTPEVKRRPQPLWDSLIDAMAVRHGIQIASRNHADFRHGTVFNPWSGEIHNP